MKIDIFQSFVNDQQKNSLDCGFIPLNALKLSNENLREFGLYLTSFDQNLHLEADYFGIFSHKFFLKSGLTSESILSHIEKNPGKDLYLFNPYPQNSYYSFNIWDQGEVFHPGIIELSDKLFLRAGLKISASKAPRMNHSNLVYCNFWVGSSRFCELYSTCLKKIWNALQSFTESERADYYNKTNYIVSDCCYLPFIVERLISTFISFDGFLVSSYFHDEAATLNRCIHPFEIGVVRNLKKTIDSWDDEGLWSVDRRTVINGLCHLNKLYYDHYFSEHVFPLK